MAKLVEILARELKEWPDKYCFLTQSAIDCSVYGGFDLKSQEDVEAFDPNLELGERHTQKEMYPSVTEKQWQAERDRQKGGEWKRHRGGKCPVHGDQMVEVKLRDGDIQQAYARCFAWPYESCDIYANIMKYKVISQPQAEEIEVSNPELTYKLDWVEVDAAPDYSVGKWHQIDGPIKWRDQIVELEAHEEDIQREIASLHARLTQEGFSLVRQYPSASTDSPAIDMSDWRNWKVGDIISVTNDYDVADGEYSIIEVEHKAYEGDMPVKTDDGWPDMDCATIKFIRRP